MATTYKCNEFRMVNTATPTQVKKHYCQMNELEKEFVKQSVAKIDVDKMIISPHLEEKMVNEGITFGMDIIKDTIKRFNVETDLIEVNRNKDNSTRVCFKSKKIVDVNVNGRIEKCRLCWSYNYVNHHIVTVWWNTVEYAKRIPNLNRNYDRRLDIITHLKKFI